MADTPTYFTNCGPASCPILDRIVPGSIGGLESPACGLPIGEACAFPCDDRGRAVWRLIVHNAAVPGRWVVVDRGFIMVEG